MPPAGPRRIAFAQASPPLVAQALADARARLVRHFPTLRWATWRDTLRQLQLDLLVDGNAVTFDWEDLVRRVQVLAASVEQPALETPMNGSADAQLRAYQQQAIRALAELEENPEACGPLVYALVTQLAQGSEVAVRVSDASPEASPRPARPPVLDSLFPSPGPAEETTDSQEEGREGAKCSPTSLGVPQPNPLAQVFPQNASARRTFQDIVQHHPRANGKVGFTVRELRTTMRISAASLTEARANPGRLSVNAVMALAEAMGESPLSVFADLVAEAGTTKKSRRKKPVTRLERLESNPLQQLAYLREGRM